jgi:Second Messenger Oligonucleotide or Dinucleotide Synthetase domain
LRLLPNIARHPCAGPCGALGQTRDRNDKEKPVNFNSRDLPRSALPEVIDVLLADIAIRVQLTKTDHDKAVDRFQTMRDWIDRPGSPLHGLVALMYPQGSMAIGTTIARASDREEYDIDVIVALLIARDSDPEVVLDALYQAIRGAPGSRYYDKTTRHTRCVCVTYEDGMHIDLTPAVLVIEREPRSSVIFHSKPEDRAEPKLRLLANPWGLAEWFKQMTPLEADFAKMFEGRAMAHDRAPGEPVPDQEPAYRKSRAVIALQLIKRWRNVLFAKRERAKLLRPPSVLLSKHVADHANRTATLSQEVEHQAQQLLVRLEVEKAAGRLIHEVNPRCREDVLTDRWPEVPVIQNVMIDDLHDFTTSMRLLRSGTLSIDKMGVVLERLFGERPARSAVNDYMFPPSRPHVEYGTGRIVRPAVAAVTAPAVRPVASHTFFGDDR